LAFALCLGLVILLWALVYLLGDLILMVQFKVRNWAWDEPDTLYRILLLGLFGEESDCSVRKEPILSIHGNDRLQMIFEMTCNRPGIGVRWGPAGGVTRPKGRTRYNLVPTVVPNDERPFDRRNWVYRLDLDGLEWGTRYSYTLFIAPDILFPIENDVGNDTAHRILRQYDFTWFGGERAEKQPDDEKPSHSVGPVQIAIFGDNQSGIKQFIAVNRALGRLSHKYPNWYPDPSTFPSLLLHAGDVVQSFKSMQQWQTDFIDPLQHPYRQWGNFVVLLPSPRRALQWFLRQRPALRPPGLTMSTPALFAHGNHDRDIQGENVYTTGRGRNQASPLGQFDQQDLDGPLPGIEAGGWEAVTIGVGSKTTARVIVLDSNIPFGESDQVDWFLKQVENSAWVGATYRIVLVHIPPFVEFWDPESWSEKGKKEHAWTREMRVRWMPLFNRAKVDLVISGHQHAYSRGFLPSDPNLVDVLQRVETGRWKGGGDGRPEHALMIEEERSSLLDRTGPTTYRLGGNGEHRGTMYTIAGGAGGELDMDRVEDWGLYEKSIKGLHHFVVMTMEQRQDGDAVLTWRAFDTRTRVIDTFEMIKSVQ